jgi:hypothetical protein
VLPDVHTVRGAGPTRKTFGHSRSGNQQARRAPELISRGKTGNADPFVCYYHDVPRALAEEALRRDTPERACEIAAKAAAAPGPGGAPLNMPIEVRRGAAGDERAPRGGVSPRRHRALARGRSDRRRAPAVSAGCRFP